MKAHRSLSGSEGDATANVTDDDANRLTDSHEPGSVAAGPAGECGEWLDGETFSRVYQEFEPSVRAVCAAQLRNHPDTVDDAVQEAFRRLLEQRSTIRKPTSIGPWLRRTAKRICIDYRRLARHGRETSLDWEPDGHDACDTQPRPDDAVLQRARAVAVLGGIRPVQAALLIDHYVDDRPVAEIARRHLSTPGSIRVRLLTARRQAEAFGASQGWRGFLPFPLWRPLRAALRHARQANAHVIATTAPFWIAGLLLIPIYRVPFDVRDDLGNGGAPASVEASAATPASGSERPAPTREAAKPRIGKPVRAAVPRPSGGEAASGTKPIVPASLDLPLTDRRVTTQAPPTPRAQEVGVRTPATGRIASVQTYEDERDGRDVDRAACRAAKRSPALLYCETTP